MKVTVIFYANLRDLTGKKGPMEFDIEEGATVSELLDELFLEPIIKEVMLDENQEVKSDITILRNGREIRFLEGIETVLESGDEVSIFPLVAGG